MHTNLDERNKSAKVQSIWKKEKENSAKVQSIWKKEKENQLVISIIITIIIRFIIIIINKYPPTESKRPYPPPFFLF